MFRKTSGVPRSCAAVRSWCTTSKSLLASAPATIAEVVTGMASGGSRSPVAIRSNTMGSVITASAVRTSRKWPHATGGQLRADGGQHLRAAPQRNAELPRAQEPGVDGVFHVRAEAPVYVLCGVGDAMTRACRPPLGGENFGAGRHVVVQRPHRAQIRRAQRFDVDITVRQAVLHRLEAAD